MRARIAVASMVVLFAPGLASAQTCVPRFFSVVPDGRIYSKVVPASTIDADLFDGHAGRSYSVEVTTPFENFGSAPFALFINTGGGDCTLANEVAVRNVTTFDPSPSGFNSIRVTFTLTANALVYATVQNTDAGGGHTYNITVNDTTQFSPAWSTFGSFDTFYSFMNTSSGSCSGIVTLTNTAGVVQDALAFTAAAGGTVSSNTSAMATPRNQAGTAIMTHDCPPGALLPEAAIANFSISPTPYFQFVHFQPQRENQH